MSIRPDFFLYSCQMHLCSLQCSALLWLSEVQYVVRLSCQPLDRSLHSFSHLLIPPPVNVLPSQYSADVEIAHPDRWFSLTRPSIQRGSGRQTHLNSVYSSFEGCSVYNSVEFWKIHSLDHISVKCFLFHHLILIPGRIEKALKHVEHHRNTAACTLCTSFTF